jgi:hypothetical protein
MFMRLLGGPIVLVLLLSGCSTAPTVRVDKAGDAVANCRSMGWLRTASSPEPLSEQHVRAAIFEELRKKGYTVTSDKPDCRVTYAMSTHERPGAKPRVGVGVGGGSGGIGGGIGVSLPVGKRERYSGEFSIDVIDAAKNAQIWHGTAEAAFTSEEISAKEAEQIVGAILAKLPKAAARVSE